jgi:DNA-directed RNA polymerase subunit RPC12/RpoP
MDSVDKTIAAIDNRCPKCGNEITMIPRPGNSPGFSGARPAPALGQGAIQCQRCGVLLWLDSIGHVIQQ